MFKARITEILGIEYPLIQGDMRILEMEEHGATLEKLRVSGPWA